MTTFAHASSKLGTIKAETRSIAREVFDAAEKAGVDVWFMWGDGPGNEHGSGLALDFMVRNAAGGTFVRNYLWTHRERLRLRHVIWDQRITSTAVRPGVVRLMPDRGSVTENHKDHVHVWFYAGAYRKPTARPRPTGTGSAGDWPDSWTLKRGVKNARVGQLQQALKAVFPLYAGKLAIDNSFGPATEKAVREFQRRAGLTVDGKAGPATHKALRRYGINLPLPKGYRL